MSFTSGIEPIIVFLINMLDCTFKDKIYSETQLYR